MKLLKFIAYLIYTNNKKSRYGAPYANAIIGMAFLFILNVFPILMIFNLMDVLPSFSKEHRLLSYFEYFLFLLPIITLFILLIRRSELEKMNFDDAKIKRGNIFLLIYFFLLLALLVFLIWYKKGIVM